MTWINTIAYDQADGPLQALYDRIKGPANNIDNIMLAHSLRPHTLTGHMTLYKHVLHHPRNTLAQWFLEAIGVYTSMLNRCDYCIEHHCAGMRRLIGNDVRFAAVRSALESNALAGAFDAREVAALGYARTLTECVTNVSEADVGALREAGWDDGEILEINQVTAYFNYANRTVVGLGIRIEGDVLGLSPSEGADPANWQHR